MTPTPILSVAAQELRRCSLSPATLDRYRFRWSKFVDWCQKEGVPYLPTSSTTVANYLGTIPSERTMSTLHLIVAAIKHAHESRNLQIDGLPCVYSEVLAGFRRNNAHLVHRAPPIDLELLESVTSAIPSTAIGLRDKAMLLLSFFTGFRRREITSLQTEHVTILPDGNMETILLQSKTSALPETLYVQRRSEEKASVCPVRAVQEWRRIANITSGSLFRRFTPQGKVSPYGIDAQTFYMMVKKYFGKGYSGHSMRRGVATTMDQCGMSLPEISSRLRHKSTQTTMGYVEVNRGIQAAQKMEEAFERRQK